MKVNFRIKWSNVFKRSVLNGKSILPLCSKLYWYPILARAWRVRIFWFVQISFSLGNSEGCWMFAWKEIVFCIISTRADASSITNNCWSLWALTEICLNRSSFYSFMWHFIVTWTWILVERFFRQSFSNCEWINSFWMVYVVVTGTRNLISVI